MKFEVGDEVRLKDPTKYIYSGNSHPGHAKRVGNNIGVVKSVGDQSLKVRWSNTLVNRGETNDWFIDKKAVVLVTPTEEEVQEAINSIASSVGNA